MYKCYTYLAKYFTKKGYAFITIQNDILGDDDGLETLDPKAIQDEARRHLYMRGESNILFVIKSLKRIKNISLKLNKLIFSGHSNGGDIVKYFANNHPKLTQNLILFDARRAKLKLKTKLHVLMFEADDTTTDLEVIPNPMQKDNSMRSNLDLIIVKPSGALHESYTDQCIYNKLKNEIFNTIDWFLKFHK